VLKPVSERTQPLEKFGGFKLPARNYSAAMPPKIVGGFTLPSREIILLQRCKKQERF
jgi:hypothetical protein